MKGATVGFGRAAKGDLSRKILERTDGKSPLRTLFASQRALTGTNNRWHNPNESDVGAIPRGDVHPLAGLNRMSGLDGGGGVLEADEEFWSSIVARIAVISDIHSNLPALDAVLDDIERAGGLEIICLGDVIGYGCQPEACIGRLAGRCMVSVRGNHEDALFDDSIAEEFNPIARTALEWTRKRLSPEHVRCLAQTRLVFDRSPFLMCVHDTPVPPSTTGYVGDPLTAGLAFRGVDARVCLVGHTHVPLAFHTGSDRCEDRLGPCDVEATILHEDEPYSLRPVGRHILNPGSVGQPRDGDPRASYAILDLKAGMFELRRVEYDVAEAQRQMRRAGLPDLLAHRLALGA
jgi:diadenosine tetraphosphatase ApaH/serine/threonine PP2A family protein phosphatase